MYYMLVTPQFTRLFLHGGVDVVLESSRSDIYAPVLCSSRLAMKQNSGKLNSYLF